ncbi:hypothetical protein ACOKFD_15565 [Flagellimonas sp. S174]|uniref:hypothetical protein n=1 Tax=Flagellimonas sp. S174 TaxID=3410790 RepID=UPI003BF5C201
MFKKDPREFDIQGRQIIRGMAINEYVPNKVLPYLRKGAQDQGLVWQKVIQDCVLYIDDKKGCSIMHNVEKWPFSGTLLLTYNLCPNCGHRTSYPKKWLNLEHTLGDMKYCH